MKTKRFLSRILAVALAALMLISSFSAVTAVVVDKAPTSANVELDETAADVELAETGASQTFVSGEYVYFKNFTISGWSDAWIVSGVKAWFYVWGGSTGSHSYAFELYSGTANTNGAIYRAKINTADTYTNFIITRCNSSSTSAFDSVYNQTGDCSFSSSKYNCYTSISVSGTGYTGSHYAVAPSGVTAVVTNAQSGSGTSSDPYLVAPGASFTVKLTGTKSDPGMEGFGWNINSTSSKAGTGTSTTWSKSYTASTTANTTTTYTGYAWNYEYSTSYYSSSYKTSNTVYVKTIQNTHTLTVNQSGGTGTVKIDGTTATSADITDGETASVSVTPPTGYKIASISGAGISATDKTGTYTATTSAITADATITVTYEKLTYTVEFLTYDGSSVIKSETVEYGGSATAPTAVPTREGYTFTGWDTDYTNVTSNLSIKALYEIITYGVTVSAQPTDGGTAKVNGLDSATVEYGNQVTLTATANDGYSFTGWEITGDYTLQGGTTEGSETCYIIPTTDITAVATFTALPTYSVIVDCGTGITIDGSGQKSFTVIEGRELTLEVEVTNGYHFTGWEEATDKTITYTSGDANSTTITIKPTDDLYITAKSAANTGTITAGAATGGIVSPSGSTASSYNSAKTFTATANEGYHFKDWTISGTKDVDYVITSQSGNQIAIHTIKQGGSVTLTANFEINSYTVTFYNGSTVVDTQTVTHGSAATAPASPTKRGYTFSSWDTDFTNITANTIVNAVFTANTYTVGTAVTPTGGGTATASTTNFTYSDTGSVTLTANADSSFNFTKWTFSSTSYELVEGSVTSTTIKIRPYANITATANFTEGQFLTVHTYSESDYDYLYLYESNGSSTNKPNGEYPGTQQPSTTTFGGVIWDTSKEFELTDGYSSDVGAVLSNGASGFPSGTGYLVIFNNTLGWSNVYVYNKTSAFWGDVGATPVNATGQKMTRFGTTNYYYAYITGGPYVAFSKDNQIGYNNMYNTAAAYRGDYASSKPMYSPGTTVSQTLNGTSYYNNGSWAAEPSVEQKTNSISLDEYLYTSGVWNGINEVWIYQNGTSITVTTRGELVDLLETLASTYNYGTNDFGFTDTTWSAFVSAYESALTVSGAKASTQTQVDNALAALQEAYDNLEYLKQINLTVAITGKGTVQLEVGDLSTSLTGSNYALVYESSKPLVTATPGDNYYVASIRLGTSNIATNSNAAVSKTLPKVSEGMTLYVEFKEKPYITIEQPSSGGTFTATSGYVDYGAIFSVSEYVNPADGYRLKGWYIDGVLQSLTSATITTACTISVEYEVIPQVAVYAKTNNAAWGTNTRVPSTDTVKDGSEVTFTATAKSSDYQLAYWLVNGVKTAASGNTLTVTLDGVTTVIAYFEEVDKVRIYFGGNSSIKGLSSSRKFFVRNSTTGSVYEMKYSSETGYYYADVPNNAYTLDFYAMPTTTTVANFSIANATNYWDNPATRSSTQYTYTITEAYGSTNNGTGSWSTTTKFTDNYVIYLVDGALAQDETDSHGEKYKGNSTFAETYVGTNLTSSTSSTYWHGDPALSGTNAQFEVLEVMANDGDAITISWNTQVFADTETTGSDGITYEYEVLGFVVNGVTVDAVYLGNGLYQGTYTFKYNEDAVITDYLIVPVYRHTAEYCEYHEVDMIELTVIKPTATAWGDMVSAYTWYDNGYRPNDDWPGEPLLQSKTQEGTYTMYVETNQGDYVIAGITFSNFVGTNYGGIDENADEVGSQLWKRISANTGYVKDWSSSASKHETTWIQTYDYNEFMMLYKQGYRNITFKFYDNTIDFAEGNEHFNNKLTNTVGSTYSQVSYSTILAGSSKYHFEADFDISPITNKYVDIFGREIDEATADKSDPLIVVRTGPNECSNGDYVVYNYYYDKNGKYLGNSRSDIPKYFKFNEDGTFNSVDTGAEYYVTPLVSTTTLATYANHYVLYSYETETNPLNVLGDKSDGQDKSNASRLDGNWYGILPGKELPVNVVAVLWDGTSYRYNEDALSEGRNIGVYGEEEYGNGFVNGGEVVSVVSGTEVALYAYAKPGYKFLGWKNNVNGAYFTQNTSVNVSIISASTFYAVFEKIAEGSFVVNHYIYAGSSGDGVASYVPEPHGGSANLTVAVKNNTTGDSANGVNSASVEYTEGDILTITITTDPLGIDTFFAWYTESALGNGLFTYEEIGVEQSFVGSKELVSFTFTFDTGKSDLNTINLYSDLTKVSAKAKLVYKYYNRYNELKQYVVTDVELSYEEIENDYTPSNDTIIKYAPQVDDYFKWTTWSLEDTGKYSATSSYATLTATHNDKTYHAVVTNGEEVIYDKWVPYNHLIEFNWNDTANYEPLENFSYWAEVDAQGNIIRILSYNLKYYYRVTRDINVRAITTESNDMFGIYIDDPEIHREQVTDDYGNVIRDVVYVDILNAILVNNKVANLPSTELNVLMEDPEFKSKVQYGMILVRDTTYDYNAALKENENAEVIYPDIYDNNQDELKSLLLANYTQSRFDNGDYKYYNYNNTGSPLTNFNRYLFALPYQNMGASGEAMRGASFKAYGYFIYDGTVYISNGVDVSTYEKGTQEYVPGTTA